ncbi:hypothetical protein ACQ4LE_010887 [Meloidogyne hapla]
MGKNSKPPFSVSLVCPKKLNYFKRILAFLVFLYHRLLRGVCRGTGDDCPGGLHSPLLPHQMPVCDFYLRLVCSKGKDECNYLHVRHTPGTEPCAEFNRGCCHRGILVCFSRFSFVFLFLSRRNVDLFIIFLLSVIVI